MRWSEQFQLRERVHRQYPEVWKLRIVRKRIPFILKYVTDGESVLDIGAYNRDLEDRIKKYYPNILYKSMDIDPTYVHDYSSFEEIEGKFDVVLLFEVIEHLEVAEGKEMVRNIYSLLNPGGRLIMTTPNVYTPGQYWKDASHKTPYHYEELGGILLGEHFELTEICRLFNETVLTFFTKVYLLSPLFRFLGIDFAKSFLLVARKA